MKAWWRSLVRRFDYACLARDRIYQHDRRVVSADIAILEVDTTPFLTMLMKVAHRPAHSYTAVSGPGWDDWGDWTWTEYPEQAREALLFFERKQAEREAPTVHWLEDDFMPRLSAA